MDIIPPTSPSDDHPASTPANAPDAGSAADLIRQKLNRIYGEEPDAKRELSEATALPHRSKHQQFMLELSSSGKDLATIQTEWHNYYQNLPDDEKHEVWQEFYASQALANGPVNVQPDVLQADTQAFAEHKQQVTSS